MNNKIVLRVFVIIIILALVFGFFASIAAAAKLVPGTSPELPPLQPLPENVKPNVSGSINNVTNEEALPGKNDQPVNINEGQEEISPDNQENINQKSYNNKGVKWLGIGLIIFIILAIIIGGIILQRRKNAR